jgi:hypothetical protein
VSPLNFPGVQSRDDEVGGDRRHDWRGSAEKFVVAGMPFRETWNSSPMIGPEQYYCTVFAILCGVMEMRAISRGFCSQSIWNYCSAGGTEVLDGKSCVSCY